MKDFSGVSDLLTKLYNDKSLFVDFLLEYRNGGYHCLDGIVDQEMTTYGEWAFDYRHVFALAILSLIKSRTAEADANDVSSFINSFSEEFTTQLNRELKRFKKSMKKEYADVFPLIKTFLGSAQSGDQQQSQKKKDLSKTKSSQSDENVDDYLRNDWMLVGEMYMDERKIGREPLFVYMPNKKLPVSTSSGATWTTQKEYGQKYANLKLDIIKRTYIFEADQLGEALIPVASFTKQLEVGKDLFAMLASPGKPILKISVWFDLKISASGKCEVSNVEWKYEKKWPESGYEPSDYFMEYP